MEVNIKTCHITYSVSHNFNLESHNIIMIYLSMICYKMLDLLYQGWNLDISTIKIKQLAINVVTRSNKVPHFDYLVFTKKDIKIVVLCYVY